MSELPELIQIMDKLDRVTWDVDAYQKQRVDSGKVALHALVKARAYLDLAKVSALDALAKEEIENGALE